MPDEAGLRITISADVREAILHLTDLTDATGELAVEGVGNITAVNQALQSLRQAQAETGNTAELQTLNRAIKDLSAQATTLKRAGTEGFDELGNALGKIPGQAAGASSGLQNFSLTSGQARIAFLDLGRVVTGQGFSLRSLASNFSLIGPAATVGVAALYGLYEVLNKQTDAEKKAEEEAKRLHDTLINLKSAAEITETSTGSEAGNIARVQALAAAIQDTNKTYAERKNALDQLRETNKAYFGDLTLEAGSLATLSSRVRDYSQALITEAITKGFVEEIAKTSTELSKQIPILNQLSAAYQRQEDEVAKVTAANRENFGGGGGGSSAVLNAENQLASLKNQYLKQNDVVATLKDQINQYTDALNQNIAVQLQQKPLKIPAPPTDELKKVVPILQEVQRIYNELSKPSKEPLFKLREASGAETGQDSPIVKTIRAQIGEAQTELQNAAKGSALASAYADLIKALNAKLDATINPDLHVDVSFFLADIDDKEIKKFHEDSGKHLTDYMKRLPPLKSDIKVDPNLVFQTLPLQKLKSELEKIAKELPTAGFENIGQSIGNALGKGKDPIAAAGKSILSSLGQVVTDIGKALIEYGVVKEGLDNVLSAGIALPGLAAIALGVAAEAVGSLLKSSGSSYHAFATGGIVTGPTLGLIGEAGPEVIFPLDRLNNFIRKSSASGSQQVTVRGVIRGRDLALVQARDSKLQNLTS